MPASVFSVLGDRGGAEAVLPVLESLAARGTRVTTVAWGPARALLRDRGLASLSLAPTLAPRAVLAALESARATALVTGTSWGDDRPEPPFLTAARELGVPSLAVLDFWSNYAERFAGGLPDEIAVMDQRARHEAIAAGLPPERITVTGNPHYERLLDRFDGFGHSARLAFRERVGLSRRDTAVLFVSQPLGALYGDRLGWTETEVLTAVRAGLERVAEWLGHRLVLAIRPHPRDPALPKLDSSDRVLVRPALDHDAMAWALTTDLVVGMTSAVLVQAALLGARVVAIRPGSAAVGVGPSPGEMVTDLAEVPAALFRGLARPANAERDASWTALRAEARGATERIVERIDALGASAPREVMV